MLRIRVLPRILFAVVLCTAYSCSDDVSDGGGNNNSNTGNLGVSMTLMPTTVDTTIYAVGDKPDKVSQAWIGSRSVSNEIADDNGTTFRIITKWDTQNTVGIFPISPETNAQVSYTFSSDLTAMSNVTYRGQGWNLKYGNTYASYYPYQDLVNSTRYDQIPACYSHQVQSGNRSMAHLDGSNDIFCAVADTAQHDTISFLYKRSSCVLWLRMIASQHDLPSRVTIVSDDGSKVFTDSATINVATGNFNRVTTSDRTTLHLINMPYTEVGDTVDMFLTMAPIDNSKEEVSTGDITIEVRGDTKAYYSHMYPSNVKPNYATRIIFTPKTWRRDAVDMGLPSGTRWATCNVGAIVPTDHGYYFAWGDVSPRSQYYWDSYSLSENQDETTGRGISKYTIADNQIYGRWYDANGIFIGDGKKVLESADDAATYNWGGNGSTVTWEMPTKADFEELQRYCTFIWTMDYNNTGINGYLCTSTANGNSIFFPAAGYMGKENEDDDVSDQKTYTDEDGVIIQEDAQGYNSDGYYWTKELSQSYTTDAYEFKFNTYNINNGVDEAVQMKTPPSVVTTKRYVGLSVRPVYHKR